VNLVKPQSGELVGIVQRIIAGDSEAEAEVVRRYARGVSVIIERIIRSQTASDDVSQDTFKIVLAKIRSGDLRQPERLSGFVCSVARNAAIDYVRRARYAQKREVSDDAEHIADSAPSPLDEILKQERARVVRQIISELKIDRDRVLLLRYYIAEEEKDRICEDLHMTRAQFNNVISRATARFKEIYVRRIGQPEG
jgi:RNA polymerase sigma-70 factor (ECF subfamily)